MDYQLLFERMLNIIAYKEFQWYFAVMFSLMCLSAMIVNNLTNKKLVSLLLLTTVGGITTIFGLRTMDIVIRDVDLEYWASAFIVLAALTIQFAYMIARIGVAISSSPRRAGAKLLSFCLNRAGRFLSTIAELFMYLSLKNEMYAYTTNEKRGEALEKRAEAMKEKVAI